MRPTGLHPETALYDLEKLHIGGHFSSRFIKTFKDKIQKLKI